MPRLRKVYRAPAGPRYPAAGGEMMVITRAIAALGLTIAIGVVSPARADDLPVTLVSITRPVHPGGTVTLIVKTSPGATCRGARQGHYGNAFAIPLAARTADAHGQAAWQWSVLNGKRPIGLRGVRVTCTVGARSGALATQFDVE